MHAFSRFARAGRRELEELAFDHADDVEQSDRFRGAREGVATLFAAAAGDEPAIAQLAENLHEVIGRHGFRFRQALDMGEASRAVMTRELSEHTTGVIDFNGKLHGGHVTERSGPPATV